MILRTEDWNKRNQLCKRYGFRAAIVYDQPKTGWATGAAPACDQRLRVKEWAAGKLGQPAYRNHHGDYTNTDAAWFCARFDNEYVIAFREPHYRNFAVLL